MATQIILHKLVNEELTIDVDMLSRLKPGELITTVATSISVSSGVDPNAAAMISGDAPTFSGSIVSQRVVSGVPGTIYTLAYSVRTNQNNLYVNQAKLALLSSGNL